MSEYGARVKNALLCRTPSIWRDVVLRSWKRLSVTSGTPGCRARSPSQPVKLQRPLRQLPFLQVPVLHRNKWVTTWCSNVLKALWYLFHNICTQFLRFCHVTSYFAIFKPLWKCFNRFQTTDPYYFLIDSNKFQKKSSILLKILWLPVLPIWQNIFFKGHQKFLKLTFKYLLCMIVWRIRTFEVLRYWYSLTFIRYGTPAASVKIFPWKRCLL